MSCNNNSGSTSDSGSQSISLWDSLRSLPHELRTFIASYLDPFTQFLHGELPLPLTKTQTQLIVALAFKHNAVNAITSLPPGHIITWEVLLISSSEMEAEARSHFTTFEDGALFCLNDRSDGWRYIADYIWQAALADVALHPLILTAIDCLPRTAFTEIIHDDMENCPNRSVIVAASAVGHLDLISSIGPNNPETESTNIVGIWHDAFKAAMQFGRRDIWRLLIESYIDRFMTASFLPHASIEALELIYEKDPNVFLSAHQEHLPSLLENTGVERVWWLLNKFGIQASRSPLIQKIKDHALAFGNAEILKYCAENNINGPDQSCAIDVATKHGLTDRVSWLLQSGHRATQNSIELAAKNGDIALVLMLVANNSHLAKTSLFEIVAENGHIELLRTIWHSVPKRRLSSSKDIHASIQNGHLWVVEFLMDHIKPDHSKLSRLVCEALAAGQIHIADMLVTKYGAVLDAPVMHRITRSCTLAAAKWLHERVGGPYINVAVRSAIDNSQFQVFAFLVDECGVAVTPSLFKEVDLQFIKMAFCDMPTLPWLDIMAYSKQLDVRLWIRQQIQTDLFAK